MIREASAITTVILSFTLISEVAYCDNFETSLSSDSARLKYLHSSMGNDLNTTIDYLHHEKNGDMGDIGLYVSGDKMSFTKRQRIGVGAKFIYFNGDESRAEGAALALGGFLRQTLSTAELVSFRADVYYAPKIVSFGDADRFFDASIRAEYKIMDGSDIFVGIQKIEFGLGRFGETDIDEGAFAGLTIYF